MDASLLAKLEAGEELTAEESIAMLTHLVETQNNQIRAQAETLNKQSNVIGTHEKAITELQHAVNQLQLMHEADRRGESVGGIVLSA